jgi:hypothetical protein
LFAKTMRIDVMPHTPKFRSLAAFAMVGAIIVAAIAAALAIWVGLRDAAIMMNIVQPPSSDIGGSSGSLGVVARLWASLTHQSFIALAILAVVVLLIAYLLRKIVLRGLRD